MMMKETMLNTTSKYLILYAHCFIKSNVYFRGRELQKRVAERLKEAEVDGRDRSKEKEEIEELRNRIFAGEHEDPNAEFERVCFNLYIL